jgi:hypothetical protein
MLQGVTPAHKGLAPSGKIHTCCLFLRKFICIFRLFPELTTSVRAAHAGRTHSVYIMRVSEQFSGSWLAGKGSNGG